MIIYTQTFHFRSCFQSYKRESKSTMSEEKMTEQQSKTLKPILVREASDPSVRMIKTVTFFNCDEDASDDDIEIEFSDKLNMEIVVNKISALTFSQIGVPNHDQKYVLNNPTGN